MSTDDKAPLIIFEIANSHGGNFEEIKRLIDAWGLVSYRKKAIKFQVFGAETIALPDFSWYPVYQSLELSTETWGWLIDKAVQVGDVFIDVFDLFGAEVTKKYLNLISGIKLQASVLENKEVIDELEKISEANIPLLINVSGYELSDISRILASVERVSRKVILQIGFQAYPTAERDTALQKVSIIRAAFPGVPVCFADHADGSSDFAEIVPIYAYFLGCSYIEKHFCIDRDEAEYDSYSALEPGQMQLLCDRFSQAVSASGNVFVCDSERDYLAKSIQKPVLRHNFFPGVRLKLHDVCFRRTSQEGISWHEIDELQRNRYFIAATLNEGQAVSRKNFRKVKVAVVIAGRMKSSRLKSKALLPLGGRTAVERCIDQCLTVESVNEVILASSTLKEDAVLKQFLSEGQARFWAGDPDDVISRYIGACEHYGVDVVVRVTADCPVVSSEIIEYLLEMHFQAGSDYTAPKNAAVGTAGEVINTRALRTVIERVKCAKHSEYMTWYFKNNPEIFDLNIVELPDDLVRDYRLTLDYEEDLQILDAIYKRLPADQLGFPISDIFQVVDDDPELAKINIHKELKYKADKELVALLDAETRLV